VTINKLLAESIRDIVANEMVIGIHHLGDGSPLVKVFPDWKKDVQDQTFVTVSREGIEKVDLLVERLFQLRPEIRQSCSFEHLQERIMDALCTLKISLHEKGIPEKWSEVDELSNLPDLEKALLSNIREKEASWYFAIGLRNRLGREFSTCGVQFFLNDSRFFDRLWNVALGKTESPPMDANPSRLEKHFKSPCFAGTRLSASWSDTALEMTRSRIQTAVGVLRLVVPDLDLSESTEYVAFNLDESYVLIGPEPEELSKPFWMVSEKSILKIIDDPMVERINEMVAKKDRTDLEQRTLRAIFWYGRAIDHRDRREAILDAVIGLESLLLEKFQQRKSAAIAEGASWLMSDSENKWMFSYSRIQDICRIRNEIAHQGEMQVSRRDVNYSTSVLREAIRRVVLLSDQMASLDDLLARSKNKQKVQVMP